MNLILFGAPGSGKGTQSQLICDRLSMFQISTGDLFRNAIKNGTELGQKAKAFLDKGQLVPDSITLGLVQSVLEGLKTDFILDGFPRNIEQAVALDALLTKLGLKLDKVLSLEVKDEKLTERLVGRRVCKNCGSVFHISHYPSKKEGVCDKCGGALYQRSDDKAEVIADRLQVYKKQTEPLKAFYMKRGILSEVNGEQEVEQIFAQIKKVIQ